MSATQAVRDYYSLLGIRGVWCAAKARLMRSFPKVQIRVLGVKHPVYVRLRTSDISVLKQVLVMSDYSCELIRAPRVIVDAGANIGLTSVYYANQYPDATIIAIEPESANFSLLSQNVAPYPNIRPIEAALWKENKLIKLVDPGLGQYGFQTEEPSLSSGGDNSATVRGLTVDEVMKEVGINQIDILKIDIEGSEREVFESPSAWLSNVGSIAVELHDRTRSGCSKSFFAATKDFKNVGAKGEILFFARSDYLVMARISEIQPGAIPDFDPRRDRRGGVCRVVGISQ